MFAKRLIKKALPQHHNRRPQHNVDDCITSADLDVRIIIHYGIPSTASIIAFDPIQRLLAIGTLDGRIKVVGGDNIEGLLISTKQLPYKYLEFLQNRGFLISISNDDDIQVWNMESQCMVCNLQWESSITAFSVICGSSFIFLGDEYGSLSVLKCDCDCGQLLKLPYQISASSVTGTVGFSLPNDQPIVGVLPQPSSSANRVLIAYQSGLIILWDVVEARIVIVRGDKVLQLKNDVIGSPRKGDSSLEEDSSQLYLEEKEISALCWASSNGSIVAVGYTDGDIMFWRTSTVASNKEKQSEVSRDDVVKLQLSSAKKRLPVIVLHWCPNKKSHNDVDGQLFVYGGDEIGSEEVLTVLSLEWSSGVETLLCVGRLDLTLSGSFADMILIPAAGATGNRDSAALFVLINPGHLQIFDTASITSAMSSNEKKTSISAVEFPAVIPTLDPLMTVAKLYSLPTGGNSLKLQSEIASLRKLGSTPTSSVGTKWQLTGGVPNISSTEDSRIERLYVAGYQDGSVRIWDATNPILSLICVLKSEVKDVSMDGSNASISKIEFCFPSLSLSVGSESGQVYLYNLTGSLVQTTFHFITETKKEVHSFPQSQGPSVTAVFSLLNSSVQSLDFSDCGMKLAAGYACGRVAVFDTSSLSTLFLTDCISGPHASVIAVTWKAFIHSNIHARSPKQSGSKESSNHADQLILVLMNDGKVYVFDGRTGGVISSCPLISKESVAISMHVLDGTNSLSGSSNKNQINASSQDITIMVNNQHEIEHQSSSENVHSRESLNDSYVLLCCMDALRLYRTKSVVQGDRKSISKVKLSKPCCWTTTFMKDDKVSGLVVFYQTGAVEIRSLPDLNLVKETSLMSVLRWNFKANMDRTMSSTDNGHISLANGSEMAFISLLASENDFRIPESLPSLHDKVLAAAADAAINNCSNPKKKQGSGPSILGGIIKGLKGGKVKHAQNFDVASASDFGHLESTFLKTPFQEPSLNQEAAELSIDDIDIDIDEPSSIAASSYHKEQSNESEEKRTERERLFDGEGGDMRPRLRTREEIIATYRKAGDASSVAGQARNKLLERQEKLERIGRQTEELRSGAEDFASLANELVKAMEARKWWQI